jgi:PKD repeat protein
MLSTGDTDAGVVIGSSFQSSAVSSTGSGFWTQVSKTKRSMFWAIRPSVITSVSTSEPTSTVTVPIHTYLNAGTYVVKLTVTDNDGNSSSTTKAVTVS